MTIEQAVERMQFAYPQIYYACHTRHERTRSSATHVSARDAAILVHLDRKTPTTLSGLARHMQLARSTLSEAVSTLETHGYVLKAVGPGRDRRHVGIVLTDKGVEAVRASSVLETRRLRNVLGRLSARDLAVTINALMRLARACRRPVQEG